MKKLFVGIDVSKEVFDYCLLSEDNELLVPKDQKPNTKKGIAEFCKQLERFGDYEVWICMEHTGYYGYLLACEFSKRTITYSMLNPLEMKRSVGISRGKTDSVDAYRIASYALSNLHKLKPHTMPIEQLQQLKVFISIRDRYSKILVQLKNGLKACQIAAQTIDLEVQIEQNLNLIKQQEQAIRQIEKQMLELIKADEELLVTFNKITQVIGVGPIVAMKCIVETDNFNSFKEARKFCCHSGLAPFEYRSGSSVRGKTRTSPLSDKGLKATFFKAAVTAIQYDPQLRNYYNRKLKEGKHKLSALNAVANKLVLRIFAVAKRDEPFLKLSA